MKQLGRYEEAMESYDKVLEISPSYPQAFFNKGLILFTLKRNEDAIEMFDKAIEVQKDYADAYVNKGSVLMEMKRYKEAIDALQKSQEIHSEEDVQQQIAFCERKLKKMQEKKSEEQNVVS